MNRMKSLKQCCDSIPRRKRFCSLEMEGSGWLETILLVGLLMPALTDQPLIAQEPVTSPLELAYTVHLPQPTTHLVEVEIVVRKVATPELDMILPAWEPGQYIIYEFGKHVLELAPRDSNDDSLPWLKIDKQTWRVDARQAGGTIKDRYRVFSND